MLVLKHHLDPSYVLDEMEFYEIRPLLKYEYYSHRDDWEQARMIAYMVAQTNSKKRLSYQDITKFYWEKEEKEEHDTSISKQDIKRLKEKADAYIKELKAAEWQKSQLT